MTEYFWLNFIVIVFSVAIVDFCWTMYFIKVGSKESAKAGFWGTSIIVLSAFITVNYVHDTRLIIAAGLGAFIGTYGSVELSKRKKLK